MSRLAKHFDDTREVMRVAFTITLAERALGIQSGGDRSLSARLEAILDGALERPLDPSAYNMVYALKGADA